ncbi:MAG TPA: DUF5681 domain-containing protein [Polyangia bacterium]|nr:DUF5681 domain-containing protein [Polyangia bacterium]
MSQDEQDPHSKPRTGGRFAPGVSGNPAGRPRAAKGFTARAKELSLDVLENMAKIAITGRGAAAVAAGALVLSYAEGKPAQTVNLNATRGPDALAGSPDAARAKIEALIAAAEEATSPKVVALLPTAPVGTNDDVALQSAAGADSDGRGSGVASPTENGADGGAP